MTEDELVCIYEHRNLTGFSALYDVAEDSEISTGVVLAAVVEGVTYLFQLNEIIDVLKEESAPVMEGTVFEYFEDSSVEDIDYFPIANCRFPLTEELLWYNNLKTV